jgi:hypothetical protein
VRAGKTDEALLMIDLGAKVDQQKRKEEKKEKVHTDILYEGALLLPGGLLLFYHR